MATVTHTAQNPIGGVVVVTWSGMQNGDVGDGVVSAMFADKSVQASGTFGVGGTAVLEGSTAVSGPSWALLNDPLGNPINLTAVTQVKEVLENPYQIRPRISGGDGSTSMTVQLCMSTPTLYTLTVV